MLKDKRDYENEDDVDLTGMIHEYSQDNELRRKIDALKKQKEEEKKASKPRSVLDELAGVSEHDTYQKSDNSIKSEQGIPDIRVDNTIIDKTRVGFEDDNDKTLVIMGQKQNGAYDSAFDTKSLDENRTTLFDMNDANNFDYDERIQEAEGDELEEEEEDDDDNLLSRIKERRRDKNLAKHKEDSEEDDEDEEHDNVRMNKIITYVIIGIVGIGVIVGAFFGVKYILGNFLGGDSNKPAETTKPKDKDKGKDKEDDGNDVNQTKPKEDINDNSAKIAQLNKQLETYEGQLKSVKSDIESAQKDYDSADKELQGYNDILSQANTYQQQAKALEDAVYKAKQALQNAQDDAAKTAAQDALDKATTQYNNNFTNLVAKSNEKNNEYNSKSSAIKAANEKKNAADSKLQELKDKKSGIEDNIASVTTELGKYE